MSSLLPLFLSFLMMAGDLPVTVLVNHHYIVFMLVRHFQTCSVVVRVEEEEYKQFAYPQD